MSGPTKGMVAGQPIKTGELTKEYDEGFDRTFGERKRVRGRFVWSDEAKAMVEVGSDWAETDRLGIYRSEEEIYGRIAATDGTDLSTRKRHREYMKANGLTMAQDYPKQWEKQKAERREQRNESTDRKPKRETIQAVREAWDRIKAR